MKYNWKEIGKRIKSERKKKNLTQQELANKLYNGEKVRQTIGAWERGEKFPQFGDFTLMCEIFECEVGYLLCEYPCKTRNATDIQAVTGLSEKAIKKLQSIKFYKLEDELNILNSLIEHPKFIDLLRTLNAHILTHNKKYFTNDSQEMEILAQTLNCNTNEVKKYAKSSSEMVITSEFIKIIDEL